MSSTPEKTNTRHVPRVMVVIPPTRLHRNRDIGFKELLPHIGVAYVSAAFEAAGAQVEVVDAVAERLDLNAVMSRFREFRPDILGLTASTYQVYEAAGVAHAARRSAPDVRILLGGYHVSALPRRTLEEFPVYDMAVYGEAEATAMELVDEWQQGSSMRAVAGTAVRNGDGAIEVNPPREAPQDLDALPFPAFHLMPLDRYRGFYSMRAARERPLTMCTARGCPFHCIFCFKSTGSKYRMRSVDDVMQELERNMAQFHPTQIVFTDEIFTFDKKRTRDFCERILKAGLHERIHWICQDRVDLADFDTLQLMKRAGCTTVSYGIESGSQDIISSIRKNFKLDQARDAINLTRKAGIWADTNFIIGHPGETPETIRQTIDFAISLNPDSTSFAILCPFPGTEVARMAAAGEGGLRLLSEDWTTYGKQVGEALELENLSRPVLERYHRLAYMRFYLRRGKWLNLFRVVNIGAVPIYAWHSAAVLVKSLFARKARRC